MITIFGAYEYDEEVEVIEVLYLNKARSFKELRALIDVLKETREIL